MLSAIQNADHAAAIKGHHHFAMFLRCLMRSRMVEDYTLFCVKDIIPVKVLCFDALLQVLILKVVTTGCFGCVGQPPLFFGCVAGKGVKDWAERCGGVEQGHETAPT